MTRNTIASVALAGLLGAGAFAATTAPATAYTEHRCNSYGCWTENCGWYGCHRIWDGDSYYHRRYYNPSGYYRANGYYDGNRWIPYDRQNFLRRWRCNADGFGCHWVYESF